MHFSRAKSTETFADARYSQLPDAYGVTLAAERFEYERVRRFHRGRVLTFIVFAFVAACRSSGGLPPPPDVAAPPNDALKTTSGLYVKVLQPGSGTRHPQTTDNVTVHYTGWTTDGKMFDSSVVRGQPSTFRLDQVIDGWTEGVQRMVEGEKCRLWIPDSLAYGGQPGKPQGMLVFDVELIRIES